MSDSEATEYVNSYFASTGALLADRIPEAGENFQTPLTHEEKFFPAPNYPTRTT